MKDNTHLFHGLTASAEEIKVIRTVTRVGEGTKYSPKRKVTRYWSLDGKLLAEYDPEGTIEEKLPYGWTEFVECGMRGPIGTTGIYEADRLILWLENSQISGIRDPAGNSYCTVDSCVIQAAAEMLREYRSLLAQQTDETGTDIGRDAGEFAKGEKGER